MLAALMLAQALLAPHPHVMFRPSEIRANEQPVVVESGAEIVKDNGFFRRVDTTITFTNPNSRAFEGELEFPVPDGATVCGYQLEVNGSMVPGVVVSKETARVAFENEKRKGVDPGIVEQVKGNVWRTRIYPLMPNTPRKAMVSYIVANEKVEIGKTACEKFGDEIFVASVPKLKARAPLADRIRNATKATIYWDASMSRKSNFQADRNLLESLPENGEFTLIVFRNVIELPVKFNARAELLKAVDALAYDGGTCIEKVLAAVNGRPQAFEFIFSDEYREPTSRKIVVDKISKDREAGLSCKPVEGSLLATAWAANRVEDLAADADAHRDELIEIGRKYGVASSVTSLIVLESLEQYKTYKIEPPKCMSFYGQWKKWRASEDDPIAAEKTKADHRSSLLNYWQERVKWWNDPIPPKVTPKSGLFDDEGIQVLSGSADVARRAEVSRAYREAPQSKVSAMARPLLAGRISNGSAAAREAAVRRSAVRSMGVESEDAINSIKGESANVASVKIAAWDPKMPYLKAIGDAAMKSAYGEYLKQREVYGNSPAFYLDCADWFFKTNDLVIGARIVSNLSEMKLEDAGMWRTMAWRLREAGLYAESIEAFRHVLKLRPEEPQSKRDLALVLTEKAKEDFRNNLTGVARRELEEAAKLLRDAAFEPTARRSGRRGNDIQTSVFALEELNGIFAWVKANKLECRLPEIEEAFRRDLPCEIRIMLSWDTDETDVDLHVLEPDGEEAYYGHRRTTAGGFVSEDVTTGYGPEEYLRKTADKGTYKILSHYYASHRQQLTGAAAISATVYTGWGTDRETRQIMSMRLDRPRDKHPIGEVVIK